MSDRTPAQRIEAAIVRLEKLKAMSTPGPWFLTHERSQWPRVWGNSDGHDADAVAQTEGRGNAALIVVLHATIDAQIGILSEALYQLTDGTNGTGMLGKAHNLIVRLADAILSGGTS